MKITEQEVRYVADLANLKLTDEEVAPAARRPGRDPGAHGQAERARHERAWSPWLRCSTTPGDGHACAKTASARVLGSQIAVANAPLAGRGYFKVPKVIER